MRIFGSFKLFFRNSNLFGLIKWLFWGLMLHRSTWVLFLLLVVMSTSVLVPAAILTVISLFVQRRIHFIRSVVVYVLGVGLKIVKWGTLLGIIMIDCLHFEVQNVWFVFQGLNVSFFDGFEILCDPRLVFFIVNDIPSI